MAKKQYLDLNGLKHYDSKVSAREDSKDAAALAAAKAYAESLGSNYEAVGTAQTKVDELANGQVKANTDAITKLNGNASVEGSVAKAVADAKSELNSNISAASDAASAAQAAADKAQGDVDTLAGKVGEVPAGSTVMSIITNIQENAYDDTELRGLISENGEAIGDLEARADATEAKVDALIGEDAGKSARTIANEELAKQLIAEGAKESLDTLTEIAAWIQSHPDDASAMNAAIEALEALVGDLPADITATTVVGYIAEIVAEETARAEAVEDGLDGRLSTVEGAVATVDTRIETAKNAAIETAASDASAKSAQALADAKAYTEQKVGAIDLSGIEANANALETLAGRVSTNEGDIAGLKTKVNTELPAAISEAKQAGIDAQADVDALEMTVSSLSDAVSKHANETSTYGDRISAVESLVGEGFEALTNAQIDSMF